MEGERHFGAPGLRDILASFGRFDRPRSAVAEAGTGASPTQGVAEPLVGVVLSGARLKLLLRELSAVVQSDSFAVAYRESPMPHLAIGPTAVVEIDRDTGLFLFSVADTNGGQVLATADQDRLVDQILGHLLGRGGEGSPQVVNGAVRALVGQSVPEVERHLILQTLRHCHGNRTHAAKILDISVRTLRNKLRGYWLELSSDEVRT